MNAKFVFAVFLALQVSMTLCQVPTPETELVEKYNDYRATFLKRLNNLWNKVKTTQPDGDQQAQVPEKDDGKALKMLKIIAQEAVPIVDQARNRALGLYSAYLRPHVGVHLQKAIDQIKVVLDQIMPAEEPQQS